MVSAASAALGRCAEALDGAAAASPRRAEAFASYHNMIAYYDMWLHIIWYNRIWHYYISHYIVLALSLILLWFLILLFRRAAAPAKAAAASRGCWRSSLRGSASCGNLQDSLPCNGNRNINVNILTIVVIVIIRITMSIIMIVIITGPVRMDGLRDQRRRGRRRLGAEPGSPAGRARPAGLGAARVRRKLPDRGWRWRVVRPPAPARPGHVGGAPLGEGPREV